MSDSDECLYSGGEYDTSDCDDENESDNENNSKIKTITRIIFHDYEIEIYTSQGIFKVQIEDYKECCETFGISHSITSNRYSTTNTNEIVYNIEYTRYSTTCYDNPTSQYGDKTSYLCLVFHNDNEEDDDMEEEGVARFHAWESHNGYYSHQAWIKLGDKTVRYEHL